eukprot:m.4497 g.4497  ORF g.4497 m.4497 type:complete len:325 (-) comp3902_c0_seq1:40-1014(-)
MSEHVDEVTLSSLVVMKIVKHARENPDASVQGPIVGLVSNNKLDVSDCFPLPQEQYTDSEEDGQAARINLQEMQTAFLACNREVNGDSFSVGWYQVGEMGSFFDRGVALDQYMFQSRVEESVLVVYDPIQIQHNNLVLKAFRLTKKAMRLFENMGDTSEPVSSETMKQLGLTYKSLFEEVPVVLRTPPLARLMMLSLVPEAPLTNEFDRLDSSAEGFMDNDVKLLMGNIGDLSHEAGRYSMYKRTLYRNQDKLKQLAEERKKKNLKALPRAELEAQVGATEPSRLEPMMLNAQIASSSTQMAKLGSTCLGALFLNEALQPTNNQ